jgi:hypothetical protein
MAQVVGCLYCGSGSAWWACDCPAAQEVRAGKRSPPRVRAVYEPTGDGHVKAVSTTIVLDAATAARNVLAFEEAPAELSRSRAYGPRGFGRRKREG